MATRSASRTTDASGSAVLAASVISMAQSAPTDIAPRGRSSRHMKMALAGSTGVATLLLAEKFSLFEKAFNGTTTLATWGGDAAGALNEHVIKPIGRVGGDVFSAIGNGLVAGGRFAIDGIQNVASYGWHNGTTVLEIAFVVLGLTGFYKMGRREHQIKKARAAAEQASASEAATAEPVEAAPETATGTEGIIDDAGEPVAPTTGPRTAP